MAYTLVIFPITIFSRKALETSLNEIGPLIELYIPKKSINQKRQSYALARFLDKETVDKTIKEFDGKEINGVKICCRLLENGRLTSKDKADISKANLPVYLENIEKFLSNEVYLKYVKRKMNSKATKFEDRYLSATAYPKGMEEFASKDQRDLKPLGHGKTFWSWQYVPQETINKIIKK